MTSLFHTYVLTFRQQISEPDLFRVNSNFKQFVTAVICIKHKGDYC